MGVGGKDEVAFGAGADGADRTLAFGLGKSFSNRLGNLLDKRWGDCGFRLVGDRLVSMAPVRARLVTASRLDNGHYGG